MLDILIEHFDACFVTDAKKSVVANCLTAEAGLLQNEAHLVQNVIGDTEFEWEFASIGPGFLDLVTPFMQKESGASLLFLDALASLGLDAPAYEKGILFLEYANFALLINDFYNFHVLFTQHEVDAHHAAKLTQLRYAGQYLNTYPRHLLTSNAFGVDDETLVRLHRWLANIYVTSGMGHGVLVKWSHNHFADVRLEHYLQNSVDLLCTYLLFPVVLAGILAKLPEPQLDQIKAAFSWLTLFAKIRCERRYLQGELRPTPDAYHEKAVIPIILPGYAFIRNGLRLDTSQYGHLRYPDIAQQATMMTQETTAAATDALFEEMKARECDYFSRFTEALVKAATLSDLAPLFAQAFNMDTETR